MPHCQMLHSNLAVAWNLNGGNSLTVELIANIDVTDYVAFGFSKKGASKMVCIINHRFLTTETNWKTLYIFHGLFTTSSVKLFVLNVQSFVYNCVFRKREKQRSPNLSHFENESTFQKRTTFLKQKLIPKPSLKMKTCFWKVKSN